MGFMNFDVERWSVIIGGLAAAIALWQFVVANATRKEDLRWRQAERADDMLNLILANPKVINAFHLLDWNGGKRFTYTNGALLGFPWVCSLSLMA